MRKTLLQETENEQNPSGGYCFAKELNEALANEKPNCDVIICTRLFTWHLLPALVDAAKIGVGAEKLCR